MRTAIRLLMIASIAVFGQQPEELPTYVAAQSYSLSGAGAIFAVVSPARTPVRGLFSGAVVTCGVATTITQEIGGTAAGGSAVSAVPVNTTRAAAFAVTSGGTHSGGTGVGGTLDCVAGEKVSLDLSDLRFSLDNQAAQTYAIKTGSVTGTIRVVLKWMERTR